MNLDSILIRKKHVIWDWNGTILDDVNHSVNTMNFMLEKYSLPLLSVERYKKLFRFPIRNYYDDLGFDYSKQTFSSLCHEFVEYFMNGLHLCSTFKKVETCLFKIKDKELRQSILSATDQENLETSVEKFGYSHLFDMIYGLDNKSGASKVERGRDLIEKSDVRSDETVLIGDTVHDLEVGESLGIDVVLLDHGHQCQTILAKNNAKVYSIDEFL